MGSTLVRAIGPEERLAGTKATLRLVTREDCGPDYLRWLQDGEVNRYLETRWQPQSLESILAFVNEMLASPLSYLFAILDTSDGRHVGNLKVGPVHVQHRHADISYFIGERARWGRGLASEAIALGTRFGFERLELHRMQAGVYEGNRPSARALEKCGYRLEGRLAKQLRVDGGWEDHLCYGLLREDWASR